MRALLIAAVLFAAPAVAQTPAATSLTSPTPPGRPAAR